jgi:hypothetical protein
VIEHSNVDPSSVDISGHVGTPAAQLTVPMVVSGGVVSTSPNAGTAPKAITTTTTDIQARTTTSP